MHGCPVLCLSVDLVDLVSLVQGSTFMLSAVRLPENLARNDRETETLYPFSSDHLYDFVKSV